MEDELHLVNILLFNMLAFDEWGNSKNCHSKFANSFCYAAVTKFDTIFHSCGRLKTTWLCFVCVSLSIVHFIVVLKLTAVGRWINRGVGFQVPQVMLSLMPSPRCRAPCRTSSRSPRMPTLSRATPSSCAAEPRPPYRSFSNATGNGCTRMSTSPTSTKISTQVRSSFVIGYIP